MVDLGAIRVPLFVPTNRPERFAKAAASGADAVILDLEDAVAPENKDHARAALTCSFTELPVIVRINAVGTPWHLADLEAVRQLPVSGVMLPKTDSRAAVDSVMQKLAGDTAVLPLIECAVGLAHARDIASATGVERIVFGSIDFCADVGCEDRPDVLLPVRWELVLASRLAGISAPIDGVTARVDRAEYAGQDAEHARSVGMSGKLCIHPRQVAAVKSAFFPSADELVWAQRVLASEGDVATIDGAMIDEPVRKRARQIVATATDLE